MTPISYLHGFSGETDASRFCRQKARDCLRVAFTTTNPNFRLTFLHLAQLGVKWQMSGATSGRDHTTGVSLSSSLSRLTRQGWQIAEISYLIASSAAARPARSCLSPVPMLCWRSQFLGGTGLL